jgi:hypothetical protein
MWGGCNGSSETSSHVPVGGSSSPQPSRDKKPGGYVLWHVVLSRRQPAVAATFSHAMTIFQVFSNTDGAGSLGTVRIIASALLGRIVTVASHIIDNVNRETAGRPFAILGDR